MTGNNKAKRLTTAAAVAMATVMLLSVIATPVAATVSTSGSTVPDVNTDDTTHNTDVTIDTIDERIYELEISYADESSLTGDIDLSGVTESDVTFKIGGFAEGYDTLSVDDSANTITLGFTNGLAPPTVRDGDTLTVENTNIGFDSITRTQSVSTDITLRGQDEQGDLTDLSTESSSFDVNVLETQLSGVSAPQVDPGASSQTLTSIAVDKLRTANGNGPGEYVTVAYDNDDDITDGSLDLSSVSNGDVTVSIDGGSDLATAGVTIDESSNLIAVELDGTTFEDEVTTDDTLTVTVNNVDYQNAADKTLTAEVGVADADPTADGSIYATTSDTFDVQVTETKIDNVAADNVDTDTQSHTVDFDLTQERTLGADGPADAVVVDYSNTDVDVSSVVTSDSGSTAVDVDTTGDGSTDTTIDVNNVDTTANGLIALDLAQNLEDTATTGPVAVTLDGVDFSTINSDQNNVDVTTALVDDYSAYDTSQGTDTTSTNVYASATTDADADRFDITVATDPGLTVDDASNVSDATGQSQTVDFSYVAGTDTGTEAATDYITVEWTNVDVSGLESLGNSDVDASADNIGFNVVGVPTSDSNDVLVLEVTDGSDTSTPLDSQVNDGDTVTIDVNTGLDFSADGNSDTDGDVEVAFADDEPTADSYDEIFSSDSATDIYRVTGDAASFDSIDLEVPGASEEDEFVGVVQDENTIQVSASGVTDSAGTTLVNEDVTVTVNGESVGAVSVTDGSVSFATVDPTRISDDNTIDDASVSIQDASLSEGGDGDSVNLTHVAKDLTGTDGYTLQGTPMGTESVSSSTADDTRSFFRTYDPSASDNPYISDFDEGAVGAGYYVDAGRIGYTLTEDDGTATFSTDQLQEGHNIVGATMDLNNEVSVDVGNDLQPTDFSSSSVIAYTEGTSGLSQATDASESVDAFEAYVVYVDNSGEERSIVVSGFDPSSGIYSPPPE